MHLLSNIFLASSSTSGFSIFRGGQVLLLFHFLCHFVASICCVLAFVALILCVLLCLLLFRMPPRQRAHLQVAASQQAAKLAAKSAEVQSGKSAEVQVPKSAEVPPPSSPQPSTAKSPAQSPGPSPGRATKNSNKPTYVGSTAEEGGSTSEATTEMASKKRKIDKSATDCVGSSSSSTGRVRNQVNRLGNFAPHLDESDGEEKDDEENDNEEKDDEDDDDDEDEDAQLVEVRSQPLTPSRSLEMPIIQLLKKGRQIKSVSPIGDPYPDPNFP